jgi:hypothetical protein
MVQTFPEATLDQFFKMASDMSARKDWDKERLNGCEKVGETVDDCQLWYMCGKKPPIPLVPARDFLVNTWSDVKDDKKKIFIWASVLDDKKKAGETQDVIRMSCYVATIVEEQKAEGEEEVKGCKVTEYRACDMAGDMQATAIDKGTKMGPKKYFAEWVNAIKADHHK